VSGDGVQNPADLVAIEDDIAALVDDVAAVQLTVDAIEADVALIRAITDGIPTLTETRGTVTTDGTEQDVYINETPLGVFRPVCVKIDFTDHTATETVVVRTYYRITAGVAAPILQDEATFVGVVSPELVNINLEPNRYGIRVTMEKTVGTNRDYDWEAFYEI